MEKLETEEQYTPSPKKRYSGNGLEGIATSSTNDKQTISKDGSEGFVHSWDLVTSVDGPGTRLTIFLSGCPLRCQYCQNPDTFNIKNGQLVSLEEIIKKIKRYRKILRSTGGGVTLSGGEALMQPKFTANIFKACRELDINTALDTSGFLGRMCTDDMLDNIDLALLDVKSGLPDTYKEVTTRPLQPTIDFGKRLSEHSVEIWVRFVLVPGLTDSDDNIAAIADIVGEWDSVSRIEILPFHQMSKDKWHSLGIPYLLEDTKPPTKDQVARCRELLEKSGKKVY